MEFVNIFVADKMSSCDVGACKKGAFMSSFAVYSSTADILLLSLSGILQK